MSSPAKTRNTKDKKEEGRRRFSDEQTRFLEYMFETESRPELRTKQQLANKLGLHPRQVAIWFQNKRARSKSRQIELDYNTLKHKYETLVSKTESIKKENQTLVNQLQILRNQAEKDQESRGTSTGKSTSSEESNDPRITVSAAKEGNSKLVSEDYIVVPFYDASISYFGEDDAIDIQQQLHNSPTKWTGNRYIFEADNSNWWES